jgi:hypothetical protein
MSRASRYPLRAGVPALIRALIVVCAARVALAEARPQSAGAPSGSSVERLRLSLAEIEKGKTLAEILTHLTDEASRHVDRVAIFVLKNGVAFGWYGRGFTGPEVVKDLSIPLASNAVFRGVVGSGEAFEGSIAQSPETAAALRFLGGQPRGVLVVPLQLRGEVRAVLYCDTGSERVPTESAAAVRILTLFASRTIDLVSLVPAGAK